MVYHDDLFNKCIEKIETFISINGNYKYNKNDECFSIINNNISKLYNTTIKYDHGKIVEGKLQSNQFTDKTKK